MSVTVEPALIVTTAALGITTLTTVVGFMLAAKERAIATMAKNGLSELPQHRNAIADIKTELAGLKANMAGLQEGQKRLEASQAQMATDILAHVQSTPPRRRAS